MDQIQILVADGLPLFAEALSVALSRDCPDLWCFTENPPNGPATIEAVSRLRPDVLLVDYWMPAIEGSALVGTIHRKFPGCKIVVLSWLAGSGQIQEMLKSGAIGFLLKDCSLNQVAEAVREAHAGSPLVYGESLSVHQELLAERQDLGKADFARLQSLTPREIEVLNLIGRGLSTAEMAAQMKISPGTVRNHISQILSKTSSYSQTDAVAKARRAGFLND